VWSDSLAGVDGCVKVVAPKNWRGKEPTKWAPGDDIPDGNPGIAPVLRKVEPGSSFDTLVHLRHHFPAIPSGKSKLRIQWEVVIGEKYRRETVATDVELEIPAATAEQVGAVRDRLLAQARNLKPGTVSGEIALRGLAQQLDNCGHARLLDVLLAIFELDWESAAITAAYAADSMAKSNPDVRVAVVDYLCGGDPRGATLLFRRVLLDAKGQLRADDITGLSKAKNTWVRALAWATSDIKGEKFLVALESLTRPLSPEKVQELLKQLDSPSFQTRQKADVELGTLGESAIPLINAAIQGRPSAEQRERLERVLAILQKQRKDPLAVDVISYLAELKTARARMVLASLAKNEPTSWIAREAMQALKRINGESTKSLQGK